MVLGVFMNNLYQYKYDDDMVLAGAMLNALRKHFNGNNLNFYHQNTLVLIRILLRLQAR